MADFYGSLTDRVKQTNSTKGCKMRLRSLTYFLGAMLIGGNALGASLDINLSDTSVQVRYASVVGGSTMGRTEGSFGFVYNEDENFVIDAALLVVDVAGSKTPGLEIGVGPKLYYGEGMRGNSFAMGLGGTLRYKFAALPRVNFGVLGFYGPGIVTFGDADSMYEVGAHIGYELLPTADVYIGYRNISFDFDLGKESVDETGMIGLRFRF
jgi:hypothetical protein